MDRCKKAHRLPEVFAAVLAGVVVLLGIVPRATAGPDNTTYSVMVATSLGPSFHDCFRFDVPSPGDLTIDGLGQPITWRHGQLGTVPQRFKAVSRSGQLSIAFYGEAVDPLSQLTGEAVNEFGDTFVFSGVIAAACVLGPIPTNPYSQ